MKSYTFNISCLKNAISFGEQCRVHTTNTRSPCTLNNMNWRIDLFVAKHEVVYSNWK